MTGSTAPAAWKRPCPLQQTQQVGMGRWPVGGESTGRRAEERGVAGRVHSDWPGPSLIPEVWDPENTHENVRKDGCSRRL